jgi:hypothetical protein
MLAREQKVQKSLQVKNIKKKKKNYNKKSNKIPNRFGHFDFLTIYKKYFKIQFGKLRAP